MEQELRLKKLEIAINNHNRRLNEHDNMHLESRKDIQMLQEILKETKLTNELIAELTSYAQKTYEVFRPIVNISSYIVKLGSIFLILWHSIKWAYAKLALFT